MLIENSLTERLDTLIGEAGKICIVTHMHPDGDAVGSSVAMFRYLTSNRGRTAVVLFNDPLAGHLKFAATGVEFIDASENLPGAEAAIAGCELLICLDFNLLSRAGLLEKAARGAAVPKVLIDHHIGPERESFDLVISECGISSASELLFWTLMQMPDVRGDIGNLTLPCCEALLTGMTTDTNNFANSVFPSTMEMCSKVLGRGVDRDAILQHLFNENRENRVRIMAHMLDRKLTLLPEGAAYMILDRETKSAFDVREGETEGLVNIPLSIGKVRLSILLTEDEGYYRISIRSKKGTSANALAVRYFNGGGHECASGGRLYFPGDIPDRQGAAAYTEAAVKDFFRTDE